MTIWADLKHFTRNENWGNHKLIDHILLRKLDLFRQYINSPVIVTSGTQGEHAKNSLHYEGKAVDIVIPEIKLIAFDLIMAAERFNFGGLGYYTWWFREHKKVHGFHFDVREGISGARWLSPSEGEYIALSYSNLMREIPDGKVLPYV
jgi:hypothetical protein